MEYANNGKLLGELETEIMEIIWHNKKPIPVKEVTQLLQRKRKIAYTTVMTVMGRLVTKGILNRSLDGSTYLYKPKINRDKFIAASVHKILYTAVASLGEEVLAHFVKEIQKLSSKKRKELLKILEESN